MYKKLEEYIQNNENKIIAIDGPSGSGKSTLSKYLEDTYDCMVFHTDDYFLSKEQKTESRLNEAGGNLDYERLEKEIFLHLDDQEITSHYFNCMTNQLEIREPREKKSIIVVEGVYSLHPRFQKYYDLKVFLDLDKEKQFQRIEERSGKVMLKRFQEEWIPLEDFYFEQFRIRDISDFYFKIQ